MDVYGGGKESLVSWGGVGARSCDVPPAVVPALSSWRVVGFILATLASPRELGILTSVEKSAP